VVKSSLLGLGMLAAVQPQAILMGQSPARSRQILAMGLALLAILAQVLTLRLDTVLTVRLR
jgi:hypothetical protein